MVAPRKNDVIDDLREALRQRLSGVVSGSCLNIPEDLEARIPEREWDTARRIWEEFDEMLLAGLLMDLQIVIGDPQLDREAAKEYAISLWLLKQIADLERSSVSAS